MGGNNNPEDVISEVDDLIYDDEEEVQVEDVANVELPWDEFLQDMLSHLAMSSSSLRVRRRWWKGFARKVDQEGLPDSYLPTVVIEFVKTVLRYTDSASRDLVFKAALSLYSFLRTKSSTSDLPDDNLFFKGFTKLLERELKGSPLARLEHQAVFSVASWTAFLLKLALTQGTSKSEKTTTPLDIKGYTSSYVWKTLLSIHVSCLESLATTSTTLLQSTSTKQLQYSSIPHRSRNARFLKERSRKHTFLRLLSDAKKQTRAVIESRIKDGSFQIVVQTLLARDAAANALVLGCAVDVACRRGLTNLVEEVKMDLVKFYVKSILSSRSPVPTEYLTSFDSFTRQMVTAELFEKEILSAGEKSLLRSPEVVIRVFDYLFRSASFDPSPYFHAKFAQPLLVRRDAINLFQTLSDRSQQEAEVARVVDVVVKALNAKGSTMDQRQSYYSVLANLPTLPAVSKQIITSFAGSSGVTINKETNEQLQQYAFTYALGPHARSYFVHIASSKAASQSESSSAPSKSGKSASKSAGADSSSVVDAFVSFLVPGLGESKANVRRGYLSGLCEALTPGGLFAFPSSSSSSVDVQHPLTILGEASALKIAESVVKVVDKVQASGVAMLDPKKESPALAEGYLGVWWLLEASAWDEKHSSQKKIVALLDNKKTVTNLLTLPLSKSFLLDPKMYTKLLVTPEDQLPFMHTLVYILQHQEVYNILNSTTSLQPLPSGTEMRFSSALCFALAQSQHWIVRRLAYEHVSFLASHVKDDALLTRVVRTVRFGVGAALVASADEAVSSNASGATDAGSSEAAKDGDAGSGGLAWAKENIQVRNTRALGHRMFLAVQAAIPKSDSLAEVFAEEDGADPYHLHHQHASSENGPSRAAREKAVMDMIVLGCHPTLTAVMGQDMWVRLCFRAGFEPSRVVERDAPGLLSQWSAPPPVEATPAPSAVAPTPSTTEKERPASAGKKGANSTTASKATASTSSTSAATTVEENPFATVDATSGGLLSESIPKHFRDATLAAVALLTSVAPAAVVSNLMPWVLNYLQDDIVRDITATDIEVWKTPEGVLHTDPTRRTGIGKVDDRPRTADEKWERELKKEIEAKKAAASRKTGGASSAAGRKGGKPGGAGGAAAVSQAKAEKEAQQQQLEKEAEIRRRVHQVHFSIVQALNALDAMVHGSLSAAEFGDDAGVEELGCWVNRVVHSLVYNVLARELFVVGRKVLQSSSASSTTNVGPAGPMDSSDSRPVLVGSRAIDSLVLLGAVAGAGGGLAGRLRPLLDPKRPSLCMAILRAVGVVEVESGDGVSADWCKTDLSVAVLKKLTAIKSLHTPSTPFPPRTLSYFLPLIRAIILGEGRIKQLKERVVTELTMLASEIVVSHCGLANVPGGVVPRAELARCLVLLISRFPKLHRTCREGLMTFCAAVGASQAAVAEDQAEDEEDDEHSKSAIKNIDPRDLHGESVILELLDGLLNENSVVREVCLQGLAYLDISNTSISNVFDARVWVTQHDNEDGIAAEAKKIWEEWNEEEPLESDSVKDVLALTTHSVAAVRQSAGKGLCAALQAYPELIPDTLETLYSIYGEKAVPPTPEYDDYGMVIPSSLEKVDEWEARAGIAMALKSCANVISEPDTLQRLFRFLIEAEAFGDRHENVRRLMLEAGLAAINTRGKNHVKQLLAVFDRYLAKPADPSQTHDRIRESVVISLGTLAQHLQPSDPVIPQVINKLIDTLKTPSEPVQMAVSECLPPLIKLNPDIVEKLVNRLLDELFNAPKYGERRGAAYGLAGTAKGRGISSLKDFNIMTKLKEAIEDKKNPQKRQGALFAFEMLSFALGRLFEPYVIQILPLLLVCFGDSSKDVREATEDACRVIMSKLSGHCVKLVLPSLMKGLEDDKWRTKTGSIEVLGSMAFLAPKQLSMSLPQVVPRLCEVLADSHIKVQEAATQALKSFGQVIKNPEIQELVPVLLLALVDPNSKTQPALVALLETAFVHYIDSPSLALVVPILQRGLRERSTDTKKKAAQIMGNMASLTDQKDLIPYLSALMPGLKEVLIDPVPEARAVAAHALGSMVEKLGEDNFPGLIQELVQTLKSDTSAVDRSGAAQGLSEVLAGLGMERLEGLLPEIISNTVSPKPYIREGFMTLLVYLPATFRERFQPHLARIIPSVLHGLADESEQVRDAALRAGQVVVRNYATSAVDLLLPELEKGLFDENWRIRQSSVQLMGDLLYRITGISGKSVLDGEEEEVIGTEHGRQALVAALGMERYHTLLASLYIVRSDSNAIVRQASLHVWKSIVSNTPRTLKEILPCTMEMLISSLASSSYDKRSVAARTLGDVVRKLGESVLAEIVPILEKGLDSDDPNTRQGVCIGMSEIMGTASKQQTQDFVFEIIPSVRRALVDSEEEVREAAAQAFDMLHQHLGPKAIDEVLPSLLNELKAEEDHESGGARNYALEALKEIMAVRSNVVFPVLIPTLISSPITAFNAHALGSLIAVADHALNRRLATILPSLFDALEQGDDAVPAVQSTIKTLLLSVSEDGLSQLMGLLSEYVIEGTQQRRRAACDAISVFFAESKVDFHNYIGDWLTRLTGLLKGEKYPGGVDPDTLQSAWKALESVSKSIKKDDLEKYVTTMRKALSAATDKLSDEDPLDGFCLPKGISPVLPIFLQGLMYGSSDVREQGALGLGDLVRRTSPDALRPFVTQITGPLIRIIGDRFPAPVKAAILQTLGQLLAKVPAMLKPFLPQLQRTFIKSLSEPGAPQVRERAAKCLSALISLQTRLDPLVVELTQGIRGTEDIGVKEAMWEALYGLLRGVGGGRDINDASKKVVETIILEYAMTGSEQEASLRRGAAKAFGAFCAYISQDESKSLIRANLLVDVSDIPWAQRHGIVLCLHALMVEIPSLLGDLDIVDQAVKILTTAFEDERVGISETAVSTAGHILAVQHYVDEGVAEQIVPCLVDAIAPAKQTEVRREALVVLKNLAKSHYKTLSPHLSTLIPALMLCVRDRVIPVKLAGERALLHAFQIRKGMDVVQKYVSTIDAATGRTVGDYARRVLVKISETNSDAED
ncbi:translational activator of GCN4 [Quaeritorhiza haematococci]|nr:translational activator of GCN4 [Quaeritorhiza haematococci]